MKMTDKEEMKFTGDNEVDICRAMDLSWLPHIANKYKEDYEYLIGFFVPIVNRELRKKDEEFNKVVGVGHNTFIRDLVKRNEGLEKQLADMEKESKQNSKEFHEAMDKI